jgi:hypothetical protein
MLGGLVRINVSQHEPRSPVEVARHVAPTLGPQEPRAWSAPPGTLAGIAALPASAMMRAEIARRVARGRGNAELQRMLRIRPPATSVLLRSPLSDELEALWNAQKKDDFFTRLQALKERDSDLEKFITTRLEGNDRLRALNILNVLISARLQGDDRRRELNLLYHGPEGSWPSGTLSITQTLNSAPAAGGEYSSSVTITFVPNDRARATMIGFIQSTRWTRTGQTASVDPRPKVAGRLTEDAWAIDRLPQRAQGWYGIEPNMQAAGATVTLGSAGPPNPPVNATMTDKPSWNEPNVCIEFETAAVAREGPDAGKIYMVITWGFTVDASNQLTALPHAEADRESAAFQRAVAAWNAQAKGPILKRNHPGQAELGPLH